MERALNQPAVGDVVGHQYRILNVAGAGSDGPVYRAEAVQGGAQALVAWLPQHPERGPDFVAGVRDEILAHRDLESSGAILAVATDLEASGLWVATAAPVGTRLDARLAELAKQSAALNEETTLQIAVKILSCLAILHEKGLTHGTLCPACIYIDDRDSGDVRVGVHGLGAARLTMLQDDLDVQRWGPSSCRSPEAWLSRPVGPQADLYAVGCIIVSCVAGRPLFLPGSDSGALRNKHCYEGAPDLKALARGPASDMFALTVKTALAKEPGARYADAKAMRRALEAVSDGAWSRSASGSRFPAEPLSASSLSRQFMAQHQPLTPAEESQALAEAGQRSRRKVLWVGALVLALAAVGLTGRCAGGAQEPPPKPSTGETP